MTKHVERTRVRSGMFAGRSTAFAIGVGLTVCTALLQGTTCWGANPPKTIESAADHGSGPGAWPVRGALYEVCPEYYPKHSLREIAADVPRLEKLGVTVIYVTPIFRCLGNVQYLISDYDAINPRYGTEADLKVLVSTAHRRGSRCSWIW